MKKITVIIMASVALCSCGKWLKVESEDRILEEKLFETTDGFYTALNGIYIDLVSADLYSGTLGPAVFDVCAQYYNTEVDSHTKGSLAQFQNEAKRLAVQGCWSRSYFLILNINKILDHAEARRGSVLSEKDYDFIRGECLGLRALLHFEMFRIFGQNLRKNPGSKDIPYSTSSDPEVSPFLSGMEVSEHLLADLRESMNLLKEVDPVITDGRRDVDEGGRNLYNYRHLRMNYFAVKALAARVNLYMGYDSNRKEALKLAEEVIEEAGRFFPFSTRDEVTGQAAVGSVTTAAEDRILSSDVLFSVYNVRRGEDIYLKLFSQTLEVKQLLSMSESSYRALYPQESDLRTYQWQRKKDVLGTDIMSFVKYEGMEVAGKDYPYMIPVIRMSEMYLIAAECYAETSAGQDKAYERLNQLRNARQTSSVSTGLISNIEAEYMREFVGEGQLFWYYKRRGEEAIMPIYDRTRPFVTMAQSSYVFPIPQTEDGYRQ